MEKLRPHTCRCCGSPVVRLERRGRPADYCSISCRRRLEKKRALWDQLAAQCADPGGHYAANRDEPGRTPAQRAFWQQQLDAARAALGPRP